MSPSRIRRLVALAALAPLVPGMAAAAACCTSATSFGVGRLLIWEEFALGVQLGHARSLGQWDANGTLRPNGSSLTDGLTTLQPWAIVRVSERVQVQGWVPVILNDRSVGDQSQVAGGLGDIGVGVRYEVLAIGEYAGLPGFAVTAGGLAPSGTRTEQALPPLFAGVTGRGCWGASLAIEAEYAWLPWFARLDAGLTGYFPFTRSDTGATQQYGPLLQAALSGGNEVVADRLVLALALLGEWQSAIRIDGATVPDSQAFSLSAAVSASWRVEPHWTLLALLTNTYWPSGAGMNRDARIGFTLGARYGHF